MAVGTCMAYEIHKVPDINVGVFFDDKVLWANGLGAPETLDAAVEKADAFDKAIGAKWNRAKARNAHRWLWEKLGTGRKCSSCSL